MQINPSEITKILKEQIKNFGEKAEAVAATTVVYFIAPTSSKVLTICATVERF